VPLRTQTASLVSSLPAASLPAWQAVRRAAAPAQPSR
jgi:hypothetical protein